MTFIFGLKISAEVISVPEISKKKIIPKKNFETEKQPKNMDYFRTLFLLCLEPLDPFLWPKLDRYGY